MKKLLLLLLPLLAITFIACHNEEEEEENGNPTKLVKTVEIYSYTTGNSEKFTAYYDNQNKPIKLEYRETDSHSPAYTINLTYSTNTITMTHSDFSGVRTFQLDDNGYLIRDNTFNYIYENGYLKEAHGHDSGFRNSHWYFSWMNGNKVQTTIYLNNDYSSEYTYEYGNRENLLNIDILGALTSSEFGEYTFYHWLKFKGHASKNYLGKATWTNTDNIAKIITYDYQFDEDGYPTQVILSNESRAWVKFIYTYY